MTTAGETKEFHRIQSLIPDWIAIEAAYANDKYNERNPQTSALTGSLEQGSTAYQDIFSYLGRFALYYKQAEEEPIILLKASRELGKFVGTGRAMVSATYRYQDLPLEVSDRHTLADFEQRWYRVGDFEYADHANLAQTIETNTGDHIEAIRASIEDLDRFRDEALSLFIDQAKAFGSFTLQTGIMAAPGTSSSELPHNWEAFSAAIN